MNIAILGAGAMGSLFGGYLTRGNEVYLVDVNAARVQAIEREGVWIHEQDGTEGQYRPHAVTDAAGLPEMDLVIVFVKAMHTESALSANRALIGPGTYLMTLQNGAGHEARLLRYADRDHVIIGTTLHNGSLLENGHVNHGGGGQTTIGLLGGASERIAHIAKALSACALSCSTSDQVRRQIWSKLFLNTAASSLTAILQVPLGFILEDAHARGMMRRLAQEAVAVANAEGLGEPFDAEEVIAGIETVLANARGGYTSIYADVKAGARSEVDTISGSVVEAAKAAGVAAPCHEMVVSLIHALEHRNAQEGKA